jgi:nicotinate phosphoribosyltransferase
MAEAHFRDEDIEYLRGQVGRTGRRLFDEDFLKWIKHEGNFNAISLSAIPEGRVVHPNVPLTTVVGPIAMVQILETALLNQLNYQTLIATKAARIHESGRGQVMLEFGLRRAHGKGGNAGTRAAIIGGADYSSNVGTSHVLGYPPQGTHAHSLVQTFMALGEGELAAFQAYADLYPDDCILLVDTINTLQSGIPNAIKVFEDLRRKGHQPVGIRLDSGDLAYLSIQAARLLDEAGFPDTSIVLSSNLDELVIWQIITQISMEAPYYGLDADQVIGRLIYGVGTRLITSQGKSALGGVFKLVALHDDGDWQPAIKISENPLKTPNPGQKLAWRIYDERGKATADLLSLDEEDPRQMETLMLQHPTDHTKSRRLTPDQISQIEPLQVEVLQEGQLVYDLPSIDEIRQRRIDDLERLDTGVRRLLSPHIYHVSLTQALWDSKQELIRSTTT